MGRRGHGEGTKHHRSDGRWEWRVTMDGRRRSFYGKTEREARDKKNAWLRDYEAGLRGDERATVGEYLRSWLDDVMAHRVRPRTWANYDQHVRLHITPHIGQVRLRDLTATQVGRMLDTLVANGMAPSTANLVRATLRAALGRAVKEGLMARNVAQLAEPRREDRKRAEPYTVAEARQLLSSSRDDRDGPLIALILATGLRIGEALALRWSAVDLDARTLRVEATLRWQKGTPRVPVFEPPKTEQSRRTVHLTGVAVAALRRQRVLSHTWRLALGGDWSHDVVFPTMHGRPQDATSVVVRVKRVMARAGVPVKRIHDLRHTTASYLLAAGMDVFEVKELLGHASSDTTLDIYGHLVESRARQIADALDEALGHDEDEGLRSVQ